MSPLKTVQHSIGVLEAYSSESTEEEKAVQTPCQPQYSLMQETGGPIHLSDLGSVNYLSYRKWRHVDRKLEAVKDTEAICETALALLIYAATPKDAGKTTTSPTLSPRPHRHSSLRLDKLDLKQFTIQDGYLAYLLRETGAMARAKSVLSPRTRRQKSSPRLDQLQSFLQQHRQALRTALENKEGLEASTRCTLLDFLDSVPK